MYHPFLQFGLPRLGQLALAVLLYLNFLQLHVVQLFAGMPVLYYGLPLLMVAALSWVSRDPLGPGMVAAGYLTALYCAGTALGVAARLLGGPLRTVWLAVWMEGALPWLVTAVVLLVGRRRALALHTTVYRLHTNKPLPGGTLRIVQLSDLHPRAAAALDHTRIPELRQKIEAFRPDLIVLTGDVFDEYTPREEFEAFNALFAALAPPLGKWFVLGNHDLFHHWRQPAYDRAELEAAFDAAGVRMLEDACALLPTDPPVRVVGRKDYLYTGGRRAAPSQLLPAGPDGVYTVWLDHEPRELRQAAAAGADLILSGHTHGGQIWPAGLVGRLVKNELNYGKKAVGPGCTAIVSGGTGTWGYKLRTEGRTEIVCIEIRQD